MLRTFRLNDMEKSALKTRKLLMSAKTFSILSFCSMLFIIVVGAAAAAQHYYAKKPVYSMRELAQTLTGGMFGDMMEVELPQFKSSLESESLNGKQMSTFLMKAMTGVNLDNPASVLAAEIPGMNEQEVILLRKGTGTDASVGPQDYTPVAFDPNADFITNLPDTEIDKPATGTDGKPDGDGKAVAGGASPKRKVAFIYHSHNRESWYPELKEEMKDPTSKTKNITLVGKRLAERLEEKGIGAMHSDMDYPSAIEGFRWELSYKYSKKTVKEAIASSSDLTYFFDIHRDSQKRKYTTVDINGKSYAQVFFIVGHKNPNWEKNEAFAGQIHDALEKKYPGISRGIWGKSAANGNGEYNQSLADNNILVEVGGVDNTLEESYRTADALAEIISNIYWADEMVSGKASGKE